MADKEKKPVATPPIGLPPLPEARPAPGAPPLPEMPSFGAPRLGAEPSPLATPKPGGPLAASKAPETPSGAPMWGSSSKGDKLAGMPMFRGASSRPGTLLGRLKNLKTKDLAFIGAGLGVLVMAPLAEYLVSQSPESAGGLHPGFNVQGNVPFPGDNPAELGINQIARGDVPGMNPDVITPLNARNPSDLIMGPNGEEKPARAPSVMTPPKPEAPRDSVWDKVVDSAKAGATKAAQKVHLPMPNVKLAGALEGLRGLASGSTGAHLALAAPESKGLFSSPRSENHIAPTSVAPGYRGAARSLAPGTGGNLSGRGQGTASGQGGMAGDVVASGPGGGGQGTGNNPWRGDGDVTKNPGGNSQKDNKALGESLEYLRRKMEMQKAIDLKWAKKQYDELERKKMIEQTLLQTAQQAFLKVLDKLLEGKKDGGGGGGSSGGGGGGQPSGGQPQKPPTNNEASLPGGGAAARLGTVSDVDRAAEKTKATEQAAEAERVRGQTDSSLSDLRGNSAYLDSMKAQLNTGDPSQARIAAALGGASKSVKDIADEYSKMLDQVKDPLQQIQSKNQEYASAKPKLESAITVQTTQLQQAGNALTALTKDTNYHNENAQQTAAQLKPGDLATAAGQIPDLTPYSGGNIDRNLQPEDAIKRVQSQGDVISGEYAKAISAAQGRGDSATVTQLTQNQSTMNGVISQITSNISSANNNVEHALDALDQAQAKHTDMAGAYNTASTSVKSNAEEAGAAITAVQSAVNGYTGQVQGNPGPQTAADSARSGLSSPTQAATTAHGQVDQFGQKL